MVVDRAVGEAEGKGEGRGAELGNFASRDFIVSHRILMTQIKMATRFTLDKFVGSSGLIAFPFPFYLEL